VHTACTSKAAPWRIPSFFCSRQALDGKTMSGVEVASTMRSMSPGRSPAAASAWRQAASARSLVASPSAATCRSRMPVRETIHSSVVSTIDSRSRLVSVFSGR